MASYGHIPQKFGHINVSSQKTKQTQMQKFKSSKPSYFNTSIHSTLAKEINKKLSLNNSQQSKTIETSVNVTPVAVKRIKVHSMVQPPQNQKKVFHKKSISVAEPHHSINYSKFINVTHKINVNKRTPSQSVSRQRPHPGSKSISLNSTQISKKALIKPQFNTINTERSDKSRVFHLKSNTNNIKTIKRDLTPSNKNHRVLRGIPLPNNVKKKNIISSVATPNMSKVLNVSRDSKNTRSRSDSRKKSASVSSTPNKNKIIEVKNKYGQKKILSAKKGSNLGMGTKVKIIPFKSKGNLNVFANAKKNGNIFRGKPKTKSVFNTEFSSLTSTPSQKFKIRDILNGKNENHTSITSNTNSNNTNKSNYPKISKIQALSNPGYANGHKKINQDCYFIEKDYMNDKANYLIGVCDGHGAFGHHCSEYIAEHFPKRLSSFYKANYITKTKTEIFSKTFSFFNEELTKNKKVDTILSGSTCNVLLFLYNSLTCANVGDSRAVLCRYIDNKYTAVDLSRDHNPNEKDEADRIISKGGHISQFMDQKTKKFVGPKRIWLKNSDIPGLAMSRSFGDEIGHTIGISSLPEVREFEYEGNEKFIIIASDGIWEFIDSKESVEIMKDFYEKGDAQGGMETLAKEAFNRWKKEEKTVDDITLVVIFYE